MIAASAASLAAAGIIERPEQLLADDGYASEATFAQLDDQSADAYVAARNMRTTRPRALGSADRCGLTPPWSTRWTAKSRTRPAARSTNAARRFIEPIFGQIKQARGIRRFSRRERTAAESEWQLIAGTHQLAGTAASGAPVLARNHCPILVESKHCRFYQRSTSRRPPGSTTPHNPDRTTPTTAGVHMSTALADIPKPIVSDMAGRSCRRPTIR